MTTMMTTIKISILNEHLHFHFSFYTCFAHRFDVQKHCKDFSILANDH